MGSNDRVAESAPSFTAVNGHTSTSPPGASRTNGESQRDENQDTNSRPSRPASTTQSHVPSPATLYHSPMAHPPPVHNPTRENAEEPRAPPTDVPSRTNSQPSRNGAASPLKRKRSRSPPDYSNSNGGPYLNGNASSSPERHKGYNMGPERPSELPNGTGVGPYQNGTVPPSPREHREHREHREQYPHRQAYASPPQAYQQAERHHYEHPSDPHAHSQQSRSYYSDAQLADALRRENGGYDQGPMSNRDSYVSPDQDDQHHGPYESEYGTPRTSASQMEIDRKRRKRVFSNRTKTGCMTCRRRKKKCDEQHPECNNCLRGGFVCEGYTVRNTWQKPSNAKAPIPLQSKNGYPQPIHRNPAYPPSRYPHEHSPDYPGLPPINQSIHAAPPEGERLKPVLIDEDRDGSYPKSNDHSAQAKASWPKARPYPSNPPQTSRYHPDDEHRSSIHESHYEHDQSAMNPPPSATRAGSSASQYSTSSRVQSHNDPQTVAQNALQHHSALQPAPRRPHAADMTEREKMLKGNYYYPFSPALMEDRERCNATIWRFNNATNPSHGASIEERARLFRAIIGTRPTIEPSPPTGHGSMPPPTEFTLPVGSVGNGVVVEAPFYCEYGYNISIGDDVFIGPDCRISDSCSVTIGARCILSPGVKIVCATYPIDPRRRNGTKGQALGRAIVIEDDCWIGANSTILAGVRVGKSSTVGAGSLVHTDVPKFTVSAGNPARVNRGIYDGDGP